MNTKEKKKLVRIMMGILILIFLYIVISVLVSTLSGWKNKTTNTELNEKDRYSYNFSKTLDLEETVLMDEPESILYTDKPYFGVINDYYSDADIRYEGNTIVMETQLGYMTIALEWLNEGLATKVKEPDFGNVKKFFLNADGSISATYENAKMSEVTDYIKELNDLGFDQVTKDNKNKKTDTYYYAAKNKDGLAVNLSYRKGIFVIGVFN